MLYIDTILGAPRDGSVSLAEQQRGFDSGTAQQKSTFQAAVGGALTVATLQTLLTLSPAVGTTARVTAAIVSGGVPNTRWVYQSDGWRLDGQQALVHDVTQVTGAASTTEQTLKTYTFDALALERVRILRPQISATRSGTAEVLTLRGRFSGVQLQGSASTSGTNKQVMITSSVWSPTSGKLAVENDTIKVGGGSVFLDYVESSVNTTLAVPYTLTCQMSVGAETPTVRYVFLHGS